MESGFRKRVYDLLRLVPAGRVVSYGELARALGDFGLARAVGNALHQNLDVRVVPCYRVVTKKGLLAKNYAFGGIEGQKKFLEAEGVEVVDGKVDMNKYGFWFGLGREVDGVGS